LLQEMCPHVPQVRRASPQAWLDNPDVSIAVGSVVDMLAAEDACLDGKIKHICRGC